VIPDNVEKIIMTKEDYDRNVEQLLKEKLEAEQEIERLNNIIKEVREYIEQHRIQNQYSYEYDLFQRNTRVSELLEILDKGE
jgi:hypothetical protein